MNIVIRFFVILFMLHFFACSKTNQFRIAENYLGLITSKTTIAEIENIFKNDSVVKHLSEGVLGYKGVYFQEDDKYLIYAKGGKHLLTITPKDPLDSLSTVRCIDIFDSRYVTKDGVGINTAFEDINSHYKIGKIETTFTSVILFLDQLNATITLKKKDLGIQTHEMTPIKPERIPNVIKPSLLTLWFD